MNPEQIAQVFHETYERLAPLYGYKTREATAKRWEDVPDPNKDLMTAVAAVVLNSLLSGMEAVAPCEDQTPSLASAASLAGVPLARSPKWREHLDAEGVPTCGPPVVEGGCDYCGGELTASPTFGFLGGPKEPTECPWCTARYPHRRPRSAYNPTAVRSKKWRTTLCPTTGKPTQGPLLVEHGCDFCGGAMHAVYNDQQIVRGMTCPWCEAMFPRCEAEKCLTPTMKTAGSGPLCVGCRTAAFYPYPTMNQDRLMVPEEKGTP